MELVEGINKTHLALPVKRKKEIGGCHDFRSLFEENVFSDRYEKPKFENNLIYLSLFL